MPAHLEEWVDLRLAEGYDGTVVLEALDWIECPLKSLPSVVRRLRRNFGGLAVDPSNPVTVDFPTICKRDLLWEAELYVCAGQDENSSIEQARAQAA